MFRRKDRAEQSSFWIPTSELPTTPANAFYGRLDRALRESGFGDAVRALCEPFYESDRSRGGRPGIDPEVYLNRFLHLAASASGQGHAARPREHAGRFGHNAVRTRGPSDS